MPTQVNPKLISWASDVTRRINCHHNFTRLEVHDGRDLWVTLHQVLNYKGT